MLAAMNGHVPAVKLLLDMGSDINAQIETNRNTALTLACFQGRAEVVSLLLDRKANVEHRAKVCNYMLLLGQKRKHEIRTSYLVKCFLAVNPYKKSSMCVVEENHGLSGWNIQD